MESQAPVAWKSAADAAGGKLVVELLIEKTLSVKDYVRDYFSSLDPTK